jgi:hypothetical protein
MTFLSEEVYGVIATIIASFIVISKYGVRLLIMITELIRIFTEVIRNRYIKILFAVAKQAVIEAESKWEDGVITADERKEIAINIIKAMEQTGEFKSHWYSAALIDKAIEAGVKLLPKSNNPEKEITNG